MISYVEYDEYFAKRRYYKKEVENIEKVYANKTKEENKSNIASPEVLDKVFSIFLDCFSLSSHHENYLMEERKLSRETIEERKYRSYPTDRAMTKLRRALEKELYIGSKETREILSKGIKEGKELLKKVEGQDTDKMSNIDIILSTIPGFFQKRKRDTEERDIEVWNWDFPKNKGILIPIRNAKGQIVGLQMRRDTKDEERGRYFWFSSSFALYNNKFRHGTPSGSPMDVLYPKKISKNLFITEGRFKSEAVTSKMNATCISVQGVGNWRGIDEEIKIAEGKIIQSKVYRNNFEHFENIYIAFDSDMKYKYQVYQQLKRMSDFLREKTNANIYYLHWSGEHKGIDDLLNSSNCKNAKEYGKLFNCYEKEYWDKEYDAQLKSLMQEKNVKDVKDLSQEDLMSGIYISKENK